MDFSRRGVVIKQHQVKSMTKRLTTKFRIAIFRISLVCVVFAIVMGCFMAAGAFKGVIDNAPSLEGISLTPEGYTSYIYFSDGTLSQKLAAASANRIYIDIEDVPIMVQHCFVAIEDERFYEHDGIDMKGIFRAALSVFNKRNLKYGASTITQQVLKNSVFSGGNEQSNYDKIVRKLQEQYLAIKLEDQLTKDKILETYINEVNFGNNSYGLKVAAQNYFNKGVKDLTLSEAAVLASIAYSPTYRNPIKYPELNAERRLACLDTMLKYGYCTEEEYKEALEDDVYLRVKEVAALKEENTSINSYYVDTVLNQVMKDLQEKLGMTATQASDLIFRGGIHIYTPQDKEIQEIVDKYYTNEDYFPELGKGSYYELNPSYAVSVNRADGTADHYFIDDFLKYFDSYQDSEGKYYHTNSRNKVGISRYCIDKEDLIQKLEEFKKYIAPDAPDKETILESNTSITLQPQSSFTIIDQSTGEVAAIYGGRGEKSYNRTYNRASDGYRQVGSTFKVLASFLPAIDSAGLTLASVADDSEYYYPNESEPVRNWYTGGYRGLSPIRIGISDSMNIIACRIIEIVTPQVAFTYLKNFGFTSLVESKTAENGKVYSDIGPALALGGLTNGVTSVELTAAYASIANYGYYNEPIFYTKIVDKDGKTLLENKSTNTQIFKSSTAYLITDAMLDTTTIGTGTRLKFKEYSMPVAGKTGTATNDYDLWFVGYTPYYTASVWTGFDNNLKQTENKTYHQELWRNIMEEVHASKQLEYKTFEKPESIVEATICAKCGNLAVPGLCDKAEVYPDAKYRYPTRTEKFAKGTVPSQKCTCHQIFYKCKVSGQLAGPDCPDGDVIEYVYLLKEEAMETWDSRYIYPKGEDAYCTAHSHGDNVGTELIDMEDGQNAEAPPDSPIEENEPEAGTEPGTEPDTNINTDTNTDTDTDTDNSTGAEEEETEAEG